MCVCVGGRVVGDLFCRGCVERCIGHAVKSGVGGFFCEVC